MGKEFCLNCEKKDRCKKICKKLEEHLGNDVEVKRREEYLTEIEENHLNDTQTWPSSLTSPELIIRMFFLEHKSSKEIQKILKVSQQYVSQVVIKYKKILVKNIEK